MPKMPLSSKQPVISASEVAEFVFCAKAWHIKRAGESAQSECLELGNEFHQSHSAGMAFAGLLRRVSLICAMLAILLFFVAALLRGLNSQ